MTPEMENLAVVTEQLETLKARIAELEAQLAASRAVCNGFIAKDLDSSAVAREKNEKLVKENACLRQIIHDAPHEKYCLALNDPPRDCDCWKAEALKP